MTSSLSKRESHPDAWEHAVQSYLASLSSAEREAFAAPTSAEDCLAQIRQAQSHKKGFNRLMTTLRPVIEPLKRFEGAIDVLVQANSGIASPIWGPLKVVITLASARLATLQALGILLERIVEPLQRFENYESMFQSNLPLRRAIGALYCDLIDFCTRIVRFYSKSSTIWGSFDRDFQEVSDNIRHHWKEIDIVANAANIQASNTARELEKTERQVRLRSDVQRWLCPAAVDNDFHKFNAMFSPGSCNWLLHTEQYQSMASSIIPWSLRIRGRPGEGKTMLTSFIVRDLSEKTQGGVLYFFCKAGDTDKRLPIHVLRTLLWQLLQLDQSMYSLLEQIYHNSGRPTAESYTEVCEALRHVLSKTTRWPLFIAIDGLDECEEAGQLVEALRSAVMASAGPLNLIFTSRDDFEVRRLLEFCQSEIAIHPRFVDKPIHDYVAKRVNDMSHLVGTALANEVITRVSLASEGLWLYARLVLDEIQQASGPPEVRALLQNLPRGLKRLYSSILSSSTERLSEWQFRIAQQVFLWIDVRDYLPPWLFYNDDLLEDSVLSLILIFTNDGEDVFNPCDLIRKLCFPLVDIVAPFCDLHFKDRTSVFAVDLVHHTAAQYLQWSSDAPLEQVPAVLKLRRLRDLYRGITAVWYFTESLHFHAKLLRLRGPPPHNDEYPCYFEMAYALWRSMQITDLPRNLDAEEVLQANNLCTQLADFISSGRCLGWIEAAMIINYSNEWPQLLVNAEATLALLSQQPTIFSSAWEQYNRARRIFFEDYVYVLRLTGPLLEDSDPPAPPNEFGRRPLAMKLLALGKKYESLYRVSGQKSGTHVISSSDAYAPY